MNDISDDSDEAEPFQPSRRSVMNAAAVVAALAALGVNFDLSSSIARAATLIQYQYPFPLNTISQNFGNNGHRGTDFARPNGTPIPAVAAGTVSATGNDGDGIYPYNFDYGNWTCISHPDGMSSFYAHMSAHAVSVGQKVTIGQTMGYVGNSGGRAIPGVVGVTVIGYHLHLGLMPANTSAFQDPIPYITARLNGSPTAAMEENMAILYNNNLTYQWALAGSGIGNVRWIETTDSTLASSLGTAVGTPTVVLTTAQWTTFKTAYTTP